MKYIQDDFKIIKNSEIQSGFYDMLVNCPSIAEKARPGQFINILCSDKPLRRPISICEIDKESGNIRMVYQVRGEGTEWMSRLCEGEIINLLGPLGNGFTIPAKSRSMAVVGGGIGTPPLLGAAKQYLADNSERSCTAVLGFRNKSAVILEEDYKAVCDTVVTTDDGSYGEHGLVTVPLESEIAKGGIEVIIACGPTPMLKAVAAVGEKHGITTFVSLEQRMGCGVGACLACACKIKLAGEETYLKVCTHGPVFNASKVVW